MLEHSLLTSTRLGPPKVSQNPPLPLARYTSKLLDTVCGVDPRNDATGGRGRLALSCESEAKARHAHARGQRGTVTYTMYPATLLRAASQEVIAARHDYESS